MASTLKPILTKSPSRTASPVTSVPNPSETDKYLLRVTAGPGYDTSTHRTVAVNGSVPTFIENDFMRCWLHVRIRDYHGLPQSSPSTDEGYFAHPLHTTDLHSVAYSFVPKRAVKGSALVTGFDFDHSISDRLPPGFKTAMRIVTTLLDPGIYADPYSDAPYLYGPALSSFFAFRLGERHGEEVPAGLHEKGVIEEGGEGSGREVREGLGIPPAMNKRRKHFLKKEKLEEFLFEEGRVYQGDFFNPYLDFANFALKLPGFSISVVRYINNKTHELRYVLKDRETGEVGLVVIFTLLFGEKLEEALAAEKSEEAGDEPASEETKVRKKDGNTPVVNGTTCSSKACLGDDSKVQPRYGTIPNGSPTNPQLPTRPREQLECLSQGKKSSSGSSPTPSSDSDSSEDSSSENVSYLTSTLYSALSSLGFGPSAASSGSSSGKSSKESSPSRQPGLIRAVQGMENGSVEDYLRGRNTSS